MWSEGNEFQEHFSRPETVASYADGVRRFVPGLPDMHRMAGVLLAERVPEDAHILVLGAGGGLEMRVLADAYPSWRFTGIDPAGQMIGLAQRTLGSHASRAAFVEGYIDQAPDGPFDGAICLLTLHFLASEERRRTAAEIHRRLRPAAPFVAAHSSFPQSTEERAVWLNRYADFAIASGADPKMAINARDTVGRSLDVLSPEEDAAILRAAGFSGVTLFYAAFTWRGWVGYA